MKTGTLIGALAVFATASVSGQGTVNFRTHNSPDDRVRFLDGTLVPGSAGYRAELIYAPDGIESPQFFTVAIRLGNDAPVGTPAPGAIAAGARTAPITHDAAGNPAPGGFALFQVRVWNPRDGPTYDAVVATTPPGACIAASPIMRVDTENHLAPPPYQPFNTELPLAPWGSPGHLTLCIPEPSAISLGLLAVGALPVVRRWRK